MKPFVVGQLKIDPPVLLAPMEDVTNSAFRRIVKRIACPGLMFTEFVSAMAIHHNAKKTLKKMEIHEEERPLGIQIFGGDADIMAETARLCEEMGADLVDINMGCWVPKVCKTGSGAALLRDEDAAVKIVQSVVNAVSIPVTVKVRAGWNFERFAAPDLAMKFEQCGVQMLTLHARFAKQGFEGNADWNLISRLRKAISIPLIGNGDIRAGDDAIRMFKETGCDGVMVGRRAISNPWSMRDIVAQVSNKEIPSPPSLTERIEIALMHLQLTIENLEGDELRAVQSLRGQIPLYIKGLPTAAKIRNDIYQANSYSEIKKILTDFAKENYATVESFSAVN